jgi:GTP-binding protein
MISAKFLRSAQDKKDYPQEGLVELAFAGRSNVGKSSLINTLLGRRSLVRTSKTPGQTRKLNFFLIEEKYIFVDLPGYGFAKVPLAIKREWGPMVENYLRNRKELAGVVLTVDARHALTASDELMVDFLQSLQAPIIIVATKADKLPRTKLSPKRQEIQTQVGERTPVIICSSHDGTGKKELWKEIKRLIECWRLSSDHADTSRGSSRPVHEQFA